MKSIFNKILRKKLKFFARLILWRYKPKIVGVTGNVGKTSAKNAIESVVGMEFRVRSSGSFGENDLNLLLAILGDWKHKSGLFFWFKVLFSAMFKVVFKSKKYPEVLVLEYSVEKPGDMKKLLEIARPKIGVVTAMGETPTHIEFFSSKEALAREKAKLISQLPATGFTFLNMDDPVVYDMEEKTRSHVMTFGFDKDSDLKVTSFETILDDDSVGITFKLNYGGSFIPVRLMNVLGRAQTYAAAAAAGVGVVFDMNLVDISEALEIHESPKGRMQVLKGIKNTRIIDDSYDATPLSMEKALETMDNTEAERKIVVLGDMLELGEYTLESHESLGKKASKIADTLITVGMRAKFIKKGAEEAGIKDENIEHFDTPEEAGIFLQGKMKEDDLILIKASRKMNFEKIVEEIRKK